MMDGTLSLIDDQDVMITGRKWLFVHFSNVEVVAVQYCGNILFKPKIGNCCKSILDFSYG